MDLLASLRTHRLLGIVRGSDPDAALNTVLTLAEEGVTLIEVSLTGRDALDVIARARAALGPDAALGAGTVLTAADALAAQKAGANFLVTPGISDGIATGREAGLPVLAGVLTPTDVVQALGLGADALKLFPAGSAGGPGYLRDLRGPFPDVPFVPVGGVDAPAVATYLRAGATAVGVGSPLIGDAASGGSLTALRDRARTFLGTVAAEPRP
ncbi:bifunctional 4-hydroxy-2-oxoglutarate aldolase/2-dehydro-3-deoxy-phosphogluconate aldolase [Streptomyces sp. NPDC058371]|uniref:bifunctional 4-hydroxy-2-oxoglutarate aldolase/2-dehydro-3-deoxy-phosphogluconate aldolase n=1 Tax=Streptomyces sp. NPDC058371 TaxID=3346463 RepID=UPI00365944DB